MGWALGLSCPPSLPMGRCATSRAQRCLLAKALGMPPTPTLVALRGLQCRAVRLAVEHLSPPYCPFLADLLCLFLAGQRDQYRRSRDSLSRRDPVLHFFHRSQPQFLAKHSLCHVLQISLQHPLYQYCKGPLCLLSRLPEGCSDPSPTLRVPVSRSCVLKGDDDITTWQFSCRDSSLPGVPLCTHSALVPFADSIYFQTSCPSRP